MPDLSTNCAGIRSPNPFWLASAPPANSGAQVQRAFDAGWGGAVWKTLGVPIQNVSSRFGALNYSGTRAIGFNNIELITDRPLEVNFREIYETKKKFPKHAVVVSLMVETQEEWKEIIKKAEGAGADGLELNFGCPHGMCERGMGSSVGQEPKVVQEITSWVKAYAKTPVLVKLTPNIGDILEPGFAAKAGGADGLALINTIKSIIGVDLDTLVPIPQVGKASTNGGYCGPAVKPIALNTVKNCAQHPEVNLPISGIGGVENWRDAVEFILLGATTVQVCTAVMHFGFGIIREILPGLERYMDEKGFKTIEDFRGKALPNIKHWEDLNLKYKVTASINESKCIGCQLCYTACEDGAHQAIALSSDPANRIPSIIDENCVGCNLCSLVCPVEDCITMERRDDGEQHLTWGERTAAGNIPKTFDDPLAGGLHHWVPEPAEALAKKKPRHYRG